MIGKILKEPQNVSAYVKIGSGVSYFQTISYLQANLILNSLRLMINESIKLLRL